MMIRQQDDALYQKLVKSREALWWWIKDKRTLTLDEIVEGILARGDLDDVLQLLDVVGYDRVRKIFLRQISRSRHNYRPQTVNLFTLYFDARESIEP